MINNKFIKVILFDFIIALLCFGAFILYFYIMPQKGDQNATVLINEAATLSQAFALPDSKDNTKSRSFGRKRGNKENPGNGNTNTKSIVSENSSLDLSDKINTTLESYKSDTIQLNITKNELGEGNDKITYYTADIYVTSIKQLQTAFADGMFGKNLRETTVQMAEDNDALLAISGDSYGNNETGIVVRNGILYRSDTNDAEICVLFLDGTMKIYTPEEFDQEQILECDVWQAWNFGPSLLDNGSVKTVFQTTSYLNGSNPRCAIGYAGPGHYKFVLVDGRNTGYSKGATMSELAEIMANEDCLLAYNLDGGKSSSMVYQGNYVNQPVDGGRTISDIIYFKKEESKQ